MMYEMRYENSSLFHILVKAYFWKSCAFKRIKVGAIVLFYLKSVTFSVSTLEEHKIAFFA